MPAAIIAGGASPDFMRSAAAEVAGSIPGAALRVLDGQRHDVAPEVLAPVLHQVLTAAA